LKAIEDNVKKATGSDLTKLLGSLKGGYGILLTLDPSRTVQIPVPQTGMIEIPEPGLLIAIKVKDDQLFDLVDRSLKNMPMVTSIEKNGLKARTMPFPVPLPIAFKPTIARYDEYLFIASSDELVQRIVEVKEGRKPGIKSTEEFKRLAKEVRPPRSTSSARALAWTRSFRKAARRSRSTTFSISRVHCSRPIRSRASPAAPSSSTPPPAASPSGARRSMRFRRRWHVIRSRRSVR
jgi:hypothetical protein